MPLTFNRRKVLLQFLLGWLLISALYYTEQLFSPSFYLGYDEGALHKTLKYLICIFFSISFCFVARAYALIPLIGLMSLIALFFMLDNGSLEVATLSIIIITTMIAFINVLTIWEHRLRTISRVIVFSGVIVGAFSILELSVLASLFEAFWESTGAIRSRSTLLNPNNMGLYVGACLILLPHLRLRFLYYFMCGSLLLFSLVASGSRTAWFSILAILVLNFLISMSFRKSVKQIFRRYLLPLILSAIVLGALFVTYQVVSIPSDIEAVNRATDLYSASIRWDNFVLYINSLDVDVLMPDYIGRRADLVQDSLYLMLLNSFGVIGLLTFTFLFAIIFSLRRTLSSDIKPWRLVFVYYMISGFSVSVLNTFPNNQLFFISMGAVFIYRSNSINQRPNRNSAGSFSKLQCLSANTVR